MRINNYEELKRVGFPAGRCFCGKGHLFGIWTLHLLTLCGTGTPAPPDTVIDAVVGQEVQFPADNPCEDRYELTFQILSPFVAQLASMGTDTPETRHPVYADRLHWDASGSLVLSNVQVNDSERYELQIDCYSPKRTEPSEKTFDLHVFESVSKPVITASGCYSTATVNLSCSVTNGTKVTFCWEIFSLSKGLNGTCHGPELVINHVREQELYAFRCTAKNRVSNASRQQTITELCYGNDYAQ
ncbi:uncharacterized protein LOC116979676 [Amblyraja radiata]|uniref:uncharacterized protein LOC116979676 n=1 Tax=Amblyraja radiata TaxID=386614 RepID=UPI001403284F|nr:uncharacterized protein LOC116979676 [Amblyraja radiata]